MEKTADKHEMTTNQVRVHVRRFTARLKNSALVKISADEYMAAVTSLQVFAKDLTKLRRNGLSDLQLLDFLTKNGVTVTGEELQNFMTTYQGSANGNENPDARKPKRRRR